VIVPTDTVYGLCAAPYREEAATQLARLKGRDERRPVALLASDVDMLLECVPELRGKAAVLIRSLLPAALTLVVPNPARRFRWLGGDRPDTLGVRVPVLRGEALELLDRVGALAATSANEHGGTDPRRLDEVPPALRGAAAAELDGGELPGTPSTVVDLTGAEPRILREGAVPADEVLERVSAAAV
jgi:L-threonylcarbamoyladenylate synthase